MAINKLETRQVAYENIMDNMIERPGWKVIGCFSFLPSLLELFFTPWVHAHTLGA